MAERQRWPRRGRLRGPISWAEALAASEGEWVGVGCKPNARRGCRADGVGKVSLSESQEAVGKHPNSKLDTPSPSAEEFTWRPRQLTGQVGMEYISLTLHDKLPFTNHWYLDGVSRTWDCFRPFRHV